MAKRQSPNSRKPTKEAKEEARKRAEARAAEARARNAQLAEQAEDNPRLLTKAQVLARIPVTYPTVWKWMQEGTFPRSRFIGGKAVWLEAEVNAWIIELPVRPLKGDPVADREVA